MVNQCLTIVHDALKASLQEKLDAIGADVGEPVPTIVDFLCPVVDDYVDVNNPPGIVTSLAPERSPSATFQVFGKSDASIPVVVSFLSREYDMAKGRRDAGYVAQAILHVLNDVFVHQIGIGQVRLIEIDDLVFDYVKDDGDHIGVAVLFDAIMRDETP
jgi:hypothetical protein